jgi:hypothetical protein
MFDYPHDPRERLASRAVIDGAARASVRPATPAAT